MKENKESMDKERLNTIFDQCNSFYDLIFENQDNKTPRHNTRRRKNISLKEEWETVLSSTQDKYLQKRLTWDNLETDSVIDRLANYVTESNEATKIPQSNTKWKDLTREALNTISINWNNEIPIY